MASQSTADLIQRFSKLTDPHIARTKEHKLIDIVVIAICAIIAGADGWVAVETHWYDVDWHGLSLSLGVRSSEYASWKRRRMLFSFAWICAPKGAGVQPTGV